MLITKTIEIDMGHLVTNHKSKCRNIHGHRYKIEVGVNDKVIIEEGASDEGMVIDFGDLKEIMMEVLDKGFDHGFVLWTKDPLFNDWIDSPLYDGLKIICVNFVPTAENLAKYWFELLLPKLNERKIKLQYVKIWETPTSTAEFKWDDAL